MKAGRERTPYETPPFAAMPVAMFKQEVRDVFNGIVANPDGAPAPKVIAIADASGEYESAAGPLVNLAVAAMTWRHWPRLRGKP